MFSTYFRWKQPKIRENTRVTMHTKILHLVFRVGVRELAEITETSVLLTLTLVNVDSLSCSSAEIIIRNTPQSNYFQ